MIRCNTTPKIIGLQNYDKITFLHSIAKKLLDLKKEIYLCKPKKQGEVAQLSR